MAVLTGELQGLGERLGALIGRASADAAMQLVAQRAPDERMALVALLRLAEQSAGALIGAVEDRQLAADLVFSLGCSEIIGAWLCGRADWLEVFKTVRGDTEETLARSIGLELKQPFERAGSAREITAFKQDV